MRVAIVLKQEGRMMKILVSLKSWQSDFVEVLCHSYTDSLLVFKHLIILVNWQGLVKVWSQWINKAWDL